MKNKNILAVLKIKADDMVNGTLNKNKAKALQAVQEMGFAVLTDSDKSEQGYVLIKNEETNKSLVISKDLAGGTFFFDVFTEVKADGSFNEVAKVFDFYGYLTKEYNNTKRPIVLPEVERVRKYKQLKNEKNFVEKQVARLNKEIEERMNLLKGYNNNIEIIEAEMKEI